jgi:hypothetical protein
MSMRSTLRRAAAPIAGAAITATLLAHGAAAVPPRDAHSTATPAIAVASIGGFAAGGVLAQAPSPGLAAPEISGMSSTARHPAHRCFGQTDNPHNSRHFPRQVSVSSRTVCPPHVVRVAVALYKRVNGAWRLLDTGSNSGVGRTQANAHGRCGRRGTTHRFLGIGIHAAVGHTPGATRNVKRVTCR